MVATKIPIKNGCSSVASMIIMPHNFIISSIPGATKLATMTPLKIVTQGVTKISTLVSLDTNLPSSQLIIAAKYAPTGPPSLFPTNPVIIQEKITKAGACSA